MSNTFGAPGIYVTEQLIAPPAPLANISPSVAGFVLEHWRGPVNVPIQCNRWQDFTRFFGGFNSSTTPVLTNSWLPYAVYEFFANGGTQCYINRVNASATPGTASSITFQDGAATPQNTLKLTSGVLGSASIGTFGNSIWAQITQPQTLGAAAGTFSLTIYSGGSGPGNIVESWGNLSMLSTSPRYAPLVLNSTTAGSSWVYATDLFSATAAPLNAPAVAGPTVFSGGTDSASPSNADYVSALTYGNVNLPNGGAFDTVPGVINMNLPGVTNTTVMQQATIYASGGALGRPYTFLVMDPIAGNSPSSVVSYMQSLQALNNSSYAALYYPWVIVSNPASASLQATIDMPPGGLILGQMANIDGSSGPWYAPAGTSTILNNVVSTERTLTPNNFSTLNLANVNALKTLPTGQVIIWGARTMVTQYADLYVPIRRTLNYIEARLSSLLQFAVFQPNDSLLWSTITAICTQFLGQLAGSNAFAGNTQSQQYYVICNNTNNTPTTIAQGVVNTTIGLALNYPAEFVQLTIAQFQSNGTTTVTTNV